MKCDVTNYSDIYNLFKQAHDKHGHIDHAISCAGIFEQRNWFDPNLTVETVKGDPGNTTTLDVNVLGALHFARIAAVFLRERQQGPQDKTLTLLSSVNAFRESPGLYLYQTSKHAIHGLLRSTRKILYERDRIRVNALCPGVTDTPMTAHIIQAFKDANLFWQPPEAVAEVILGILSSENMYGKAFYVEGGDGYEFEDSSIAAQPQWLGEEPSRRMRINSEAVQKVSLSALSYSHAVPRGAHKRVRVPCCRNRQSMGADVVMKGSGERMGIHPRDCSFCMPLPSSGGCHHSTPQSKMLEQLRRPNPILPRIRLDFLLKATWLRVSLWSHHHAWCSSSAASTGSSRRSRSVLAFLSSCYPRSIRILEAQMRLRAHSNDRKLLRCQGSSLSRCEVLVLCQMLLALVDAWCLMVCLCSFVRRP